MIIKNTKVCIVIPALNESAHLPTTLGIIQQLLGSCDDVIVADNGSTDNTAQIATDFGATVTIHPGVSIAELRNQGAKFSDADILVFIDADVHLDASWPAQFNHTLQMLTTAPLTVTGSRCRAASQSSFVNRYWYSRLNNEANRNYINSGHLIVTRRLFEQIAGFTSELKTGEDYDFCQRALKAGATLKPDVQLIAWHEGYPATLKGFMQREMWHGRNEYQSWQLFLNSKVAIISTLHLAILMLTLICAISAAEPKLLIIYLLFSIVFSCGLTAIKFGLTPIKLFFGTSFLHYLYLLARGMAWRFQALRPVARTVKKESP